MHGLDALACIKCSTCDTNCCNMAVYGLFLVILAHEILRALLMEDLAGYGQKRAMDLSRIQLNQQPALVPYLI